MGSNDHPIKTIQCNNTVQSPCKQIPWCLCRDLKLICRAKEISKWRKLDPTKYPTLNLVSWTPETFTRLGMLLKLAAGQAWQVYCKTFITANYQIFPVRSSFLPSPFLTCCTILPISSGGKTPFEAMTGGATPSDGLLVEVFWGDFPQL